MNDFFFWFFLTSLAVFGAMFIAEDNKPKRHEDWEYLE